MTTVGQIFMTKPNISFIKIRFAESAAKTCGQTGQLSRNQDMLCTPYVTKASINRSFGLGTWVY